MDILDQLEELITKEGSILSKVAYISDDKMTAYVRITSHYIQGEMLKTIDVANVSVDEEHQGKGIFKDFLKGVEGMAKNYGRTVYVESVLSDILEVKLAKYGYISNGEISPSFHKSF